VSNQWHQFRVALSEVSHELVQDLLH
jgi:hypothetical protein